MDKKQAQQEILRRLAIYIEKNCCPEDKETAIFHSQDWLYEYNDGELSKQELIKIITLDEDGNLLRWFHNHEHFKHCTGNGYESYCEHITKCVQATKEATEIVNCYDGE